MQVLIHRATREVLAAGWWATPPADQAVEVVEITDTQAAKLAERGVKTLGENNQISVWLDPAIVQAEQDTAAAAAAAQQADTTDLGAYTPLLAALAADRQGSLADATGYAGMTAADRLAAQRRLFERHARTNRALILLARIIGRRLGTPDGGVSDT